MQIARPIGRTASWQDLVLPGSAFLLFPVLVLAPRGVPLLVCCAGSAAACLVWESGRGSIRQLPALITLLAVLLLLGAASALWSIAPLRSLEMVGRIGGLAVAGLSLVAAAPLVSARSIMFSLMGGATAGIVLAMVELATGGAVSNLFFTRGFAPTRIDEAATVMAVLVLPIAAKPFAGSWRGPLLALALAIAATIGSLSGTTAKLALILGIIAGGIFFLDYRRVARLAALLTLLTVLTAPLTFPRLASSDVLFKAADSIKNSASHRLLIWSFAGDRIAERPLLGWGLDTSRSIPGGKELFRPGQEKLPLHPHNASLQLWLELGLPGAVLGALLLSGLFYALAASGWPRVYAAAVGGMLSIALIALLDCFSLWNESWQATLWYSAFIVLVFARAPAGAERTTEPVASERTAAVGA